MPATQQDLFQRFDELGINYINHTHEPVFTVEEAKSAHSGIAGGHCKNLFCKDEKGVLWLIVVLEDSVVNLKTLPQKISSRRLSFGKPELLYEVLGVVPGSVTPFGLINDRTQRVTVILDETMMAHEILNYHPLHNAASTSISPEDLVRFIRSCGHEPRIVAVSEPSL
jgi:Ala-tRNA(Pro) deacylase